MPIHTIAKYHVKPSGIETTKQAIQAFVPYVQHSEPGTRLYEAWQQKDDPASFVHFFIFEDEAAHKAHSESAAVKRFEAAYGPELAGGDVVFTDYEFIASNQELGAADVLRKYYAAAVKKDIGACRGLLNDDDFLFRGLFKTYRNPDDYLADFRQLLQITARLEVKKIIAQAIDVVVLFELETTASVAATTLVAEWHRVENGKICRVQSVFDGRPFAAMFGG
jgi:quinol monooxygenase YgiN